MIHAPAYSSQTACTLYHPCSTKRLCRVCANPCTDQCCAAGPQPAGRPKISRVNSLSHGRPEAKAGLEVSTGSSFLPFNIDISDNSSSSPGSYPLVGMQVWVCIASMVPSLLMTPITMAIPLWSDCKECAAVSLLGQADLERGYLTSKEGYSGLRLAFQDPAIVSFVS
ncbi:Hypothetical protein GSB_153963 [Giardia duodenalis]|uniref:Uncharacterized protein n=1 Tax=Giardia intestinalis TaxID=5741 RepID=V6TWS0_GIAIN|nr:Hypothetical protein GSB_153963 [Giardia intestinalis]